MKTLYLIRHAKSSWSDPLLKDYDRPLNKRGKKDAPLMGKHINKLNVSPDHIITSPAKRARTTAKLIAEKIDFPKNEIEEIRDIYHADVEDLKNVVKAIDDSNDVVFLVGHNPGLTDFANYLTSARIDNIPTCGIYCVEFDIDSWEEINKESGEFKLFDYPKKLNK